MSSHASTNYVLGLVLLLLVVWWYCDCTRPATAATIDHFTNSLPSGGPFRATPTPPYDTSVFSSLPPQHVADSRWKFATPFQSACLNLDANTPDATCSGNQKFVCNLTPHNQRVCHWE
jgi:hypothetical protein